jgi:hypothetical protein
MRHFREVILFLLVILLDLVIVLGMFMLLRDLVTR